MSTIPWKETIIIGLTLLAATGPTLAQAEPPGLVNYQGVLRDGAGDPETGDFEMILRFFNADIGGSEILFDEHCAAPGPAVCAAETGAVTVTGGLFNTQLGGGNVVDGAGAGVYGSLGEVFRDFDEVWMQIEIFEPVGAVFQVLSPRVRVISAAYALNADHLDGIGSGSFLRSDATDSYTAGNLTFSPGTAIRLPDGTAAAPPIAFTNDPGSGIYLGPGGLSLASSGTAVLSAYITGDVTIAGRIAPSYDGVNNEFLSFDHLNGQFDLTDDLHVTGSLFTAGRGGFLEAVTVGTLASTTPYTRFVVGGSPSSGTMNDAGDVFVQNQLEVDGAAFLNGELRMDDNGPDGNQTIYFYNTASPTGESLAWIEANDRFELSDDLSLAGSLDLGAGANDDFTAADVTALTGGGNADALHTHATVGDSDTLDGLDSTAFARVGTANTFTTGTQTVQTGASATRGVVVRGAAGQTANLQEWQDSGSVVHASIGSAGALTLNTGGGPDAVLTEGGIDRSNGASDTTLTIQNSGGAGKMTLQVDGVIRAGDPLFDPTNYDYNRIAIGVTVPPVEASMDLKNDLYVEGSVEGRDQLYTEGRLIAESIIVVADSTPNTSQAFSSFGTGTSTSGDITLSNDVLAGGDMEVVQTLYLSKTLYMEGSSAAGADGDQTIFFYDEDSRGTNFIRWDDSRADAACSLTSATSEAMVFNVSEGIGPAEAFLFMQNTDVEFKIDDLGNAALDGTLTQSGACDLAETFIGAEGLEPGTLVALVPGEREAVEATTRPYDRTAVGVVSTHPGVVLSGPTADAYPLWSELQSIRKQLEAMPRPPAPAMTKAPDGADATVRDTNLAAEDPATAVPRQALGARAVELEAQLDSWTRGTIPVALVGRVPVKADASYGPIRHGDYLTSSSTPGHAMVLDRPGPYFGIAMEDLAAGQGTILVLLREGWYGGTTGSAENTAVTGDAAAAPGGSMAVTQETEGSLQIVLDRGANDQARLSIFRDGEQGLGSEVFRVDERGNVFAKGSFRPSSMDVAEFFAVSEPVEPGNVLAADPGAPGRFGLARAAAERTVVGVVAGDPGVLLGGGVERVLASDPALAARLEESRRIGDNPAEAELWNALEQTFLQSHAPVALTGTVAVKADAGYGAIRAGDLLTSSPTPGHAMRAEAPAPGTVLGKALEPLDVGTGLIRMLVMLR